MKNYFLIFLFFSQSIIVSQVSNFSEKFELPETINETSGLLFINNKIVTHNDSGGAANLYEVDNVSGFITRTIVINNAINIDWEDIAEDETHIYIADIGNNNGNRTNLTIYKILKTDYISSNNVTAEIIRYSYSDQTNFSSQPNNNNFDSEAISIYQGNIIIFTKNWVDLRTNVYTIPKTPGNHSAIRTSTFNVNGLITGASYNKQKNSFMLTGYDTGLEPFLVYIGWNRNPGNNIFNGGAIKTILTLGAGSQVEGVVHTGNQNYYISREKFTTSFLGFPIVIKQKVFEFSYQTSSINDILMYGENDTIYLSELPGVSITVKFYDALDNLVLTENIVGTNASISIVSLPVGVFEVYFEADGGGIHQKLLVRL